MSSAPSTKPHRRPAISIVGSLVLVATLAISLLSPLAARAQLAAPADIIGGPSQIISTVWDKIQNAAEWAWQHGAALAFKNAMRTFTQQLAYDTAVMLASGGQGQTPLLSWKSLGQSAQDAFDDAAGDFLDTLDTQNGFIRLGLCTPPRASFQLIVGFTLFNEIRPRQPVCSLSQIEKNWETFFADPDNLLQRFGVVFDPRQNDLGVALHLQQTLIQEASLQREEAKLEELINKGFKPITEDITGFIKTPSIRLSQQAAAVQQQVVASEFNNFTGDIVADALGVFTNTLASRLMRRLLQGEIPSPSRLASGRFGFPSGFSGGVEYAVQVNSTISTPQLVGVADTVDVISEFSNCPQDPAFYTPLNACTITQKFAQALRKADEGSPLTVQEAIDQGYLNGNLPFAALRPSDDQRAPTKAWYISDLKKLRRARIIPVGWELAAEQLAGSSVTLQQVIGTPSLNYTDGFNGTAGDGVCDGDAGESDYCGLVDPNWVLRAPPAQCRLETFGQQIEPQGPSRQKTCVDYQQCVAEADDGSCQAWGYCKREQNIWRFSGQSCEFPQGSGTSPWATCQSFVDPNGRARTYLANSLTNYDDGTCTDAATCRWYSAARNPASTGPKDTYLIEGTQANVNTVDFSQEDPSSWPRFYLKNVASRGCDSKQEGCARFLQLTDINTEALSLPPNTPLAEQVQAVVAAVTPASSTASYEQYANVATATLKQAPDYLNCYDANSANDAPECANYVQLCQASEVSCELYTPRDGSPAVPGQVAPENVCPAECNGFNTYTQTSVFFENYVQRSEPEPTINFIPATAKVCSAAQVGCEEFTNVEQNERKEYYSEMRQCVRPEDNLANTYYTWVGSDLTGYQLKTWQLQSVNPSDPLSAPFTTDGSGDCLSGETNPTPDCKQFYATDGSQVAVHYRLESKVVYSSSSCNRYRATSITQADCLSSNGSWENGFCFYRAIPSQGKICSAQAAGCREYKGPTANNVRLVFPVSTFGDVEPGVNTDSSPLSGWTSGTNSTESTSAFGHSLDSGGDGFILKDISGLVQKDKQYLLTFWAKVNTGGAGGHGQTRSYWNPLASLFAPEEAAAQTFEWIWGPFTPTDDWSIVTLGPVLLGQDVSAGVTLRIAGSSRFFIDNIAFREIRDTFFVRKNTWVTPASCQVPSTLRCSAYKMRNGQTAYLTGFSAICRNEAVGCQALVDTRNSSSPRAFSATAGDQTVVVPEDAVAFRVYDTKKSCQAKFAGCSRVGRPETLASGELSSWSDVFTVLNPDTFDPGTNPAASPLCSSEQNMCQVFTDKAGVQHFFKDPNSRVCEYKLIDSTVGYDWYKQGTNERCNLVPNPSFELLAGASDKVDDFTADSFKNWEQFASGDNFLEAVSSFNGQYWGGTVARVPSPSFAIESKPVSFSTTADRLLAVYAHVRIPTRVPAVTGSVVLDVNCTGTPTCDDIGGNDALLIDDNTPRDQWLLLNRVVRSTNPTSFRVRVFNNTNNDIYVDQVQAIELPFDFSNEQAVELAQVPYAYLCPSNQAGCTAFKDPELTKQSYYYLNNERLDAGTCNGQVSEKEGCLLFNDLSKTNLTWNAAVSYADSQAKNNSLVAPITSDPKDTNLVLKVRRDRACAEWLSCQSESVRRNPATGRYDTVCYALGACNQLGSAEQGVGRCANWLTPPPPAAPLTSTIYQNRGLNWADQDYSGYSLPNLFPIQTLTQKEYGGLRCGGKTTEAVCPAISESCTLSTGQQSTCLFVSDIRLTYENPTAKTCGGEIGGTSCQILGATCSDGSICQYEDLGLSGQGPGDLFENTEPKLCRAYPEADAPFPSGVVKDYSPACGAQGCPGPADPTYVEVAQTKEAAFKDANVCQPGEVCECSYKRLTYKNGDTLFYNLMSDDFTSTYAVDVSADADDNTTPIYTRLKQQTLNLGLRGYCLEKDSSRFINAGADTDHACLTWLPIDAVGGDVSIYDYSPEAGYQDGDTYYCSEARGNGRGTSSEGQYVVSARQDSVYHYEGNACDNRGIGSLSFTIGGCVKNPWDAGKDGVNYCPPGILSLPCGLLYVQNDSPSAGGAGVRIEPLPVGASEYGLSMYDIERVRVVALPESKSWDWYDFQLSPAANLFEPSPRPGLIVWRYRNVRGEGYQGVIYFDVLFNDTKYSDLERGQLVGYALLTDDWTGSGNEGVGYNIKFYLRELCTETSQVANELQNKAWTDRVLRQTTFQAVPNRPPTDPNSMGQLGFTSSRATAPYGKSTLVAPPPENQVLVVSDITSVTTPYACVGTGGCGGSSQPGICLSDNSKFGQKCSSSSACKADGVDGLCSGYLGGSTTTQLGPNAAGIGRDRLRELFVKEYRLDEYRGGSWSQRQNSDLLDESCGLTDGSCDPTNPTSIAGQLGANVPAPPVVKQVLFGEDGQPLPTGSEGEAGFTVVAGGQPFTQGTVEVSSSSVVQLVFYAYNPNGEQMPLRRVFVDWGDESPLSGAMGAYKNHKASCKRLGDPGYNWGDSSQACVNVESGPFSYVHVYTCAESGGCDFTPRVFVDDNWEWCAADGWHCNREQPYQPIKPGENGAGWVWSSSETNAVTIHVEPAGSQGGGGYTAGPMSVAPGSGTSACVAVGSLPYSRIYTVTNTGSAGMAWQISDNATWLSASPPSGVLGPSGSAAVILQANNLGTGTYSATVTFTNTTNSDGDTSRAFNLEVVQSARQCGQIQN